MRSWKFVVPVLLTALLAASALAADSSTSSGGWTFGLNGGGIFPTGDYGDAASSGWNIGGQADYWMNSQWGLGVDASYNANNGSDDFNAAASQAPPLGFGTGAEGKFNTIQYGAHAIFLIPTQGGSMSPFLQGGVGGYSSTSKIEGGTVTPEDVSETNFGFNVGAGVDFRTTDVVSLGVGGSYHYITSDPSTSWFGVQARVNFKVPMSK